MRVWQNAGAAMLGAQDRECSERSSTVAPLVRKTTGGAEICATEGQGSSERHLDGRDQGRGDTAFDFFVEVYGVKCDRAVKCLIKDRADLLAFYDFPAEHWKHIRTTNPIESTDLSVRHRTKKPKGCLSRKTALAMTHQLMLSAKKKWRKLDGQRRLPEIIQGIEFRDGIKHETKVA
jgi:hypothetical protein